MKQNPFGFFVKLGDEHYMNESFAFIKCKGAICEHFFHQTAEYYLSILCRTGSMTVEMMNKTFCVQAGDICDKFVGLELQSISTDSTFEGYIILMSQDYVNSLFGSLFFTLRKLSFENPVKHISQRSYFILSAFYDLFSSVISNSNNPHPVGVELLLKGIFLEMVVNFQGSPKFLMDARIVQVIDLINKNCNYSHTIEYYSNKVAVSPHYLSRLFNDQLGISYSVYLKQTVLLEAKTLLSQTQLPVGVISEKLGFSEASNFVRFFKNKVGITPTQFRDKYCGKQN